MSDALTQTDAIALAAQFEHDWIAHTLAGDKKGLAGLFADDVVFLGSHPEMSVGQTELARYLAGANATPGMSIAFTNRQVRVVGPCAFATTSYVHFSTPSGGFRWAITWVIAKAVERWEIAQHHASPRASG